MGVTQEMEQIKKGNVVEVFAEEGHDLFYYALVVEEIEVNEEIKGEKEIVAYGKGINDENEEAAEEFTHRIDASNFVQVMSDYSTEDTLITKKEFDMHYLDIVIKKNTIAKIKDVEADDEGTLCYHVFFEGFDFECETWIEADSVADFFQKVA